MSEPTQRIARRSLAVGTVVGAAAIAMATGAQRAAAQPGKSTWEVITGTKKLRLGAAISEPFAFKDLEGSDKPGAVKAGNSVWRGVSVNCGKELADALGAEMEVVETTYGNAVIGLQTDKFDLIFALDGTVKRAVAVDFVPQPLFMYGTAILAHTGADIATWQAINDKKLKIGVPVGTTMESEITRRAPAVELTRFQNINEMIAAFQSRRVEAVSGSLTGMTLAERADARHHRRHAQPAGAVSRHRRHPPGDRSALAQFPHDLVRLSRLLGLRAEGARPGLCLPRRRHHEGAAGGDPLTRRTIL